MNTGTLETAAHFLVLLAAQPDAMAPVSGLAAILQTYGAWGLVSVLMLVVWFLFNKLQAARDKNDGTLEAQVRGATALVEESVKATVELKNSLEKVTEALKSVERRLENVEDKVG